MWKTLYKRILPVTLLVVVVLEFGSKMILNRSLPGYDGQLPPNQILSGYYVFKNRPGYTFIYTYKPLPGDTDVHFDEFGFIKEFDSYKKTDDVYRIFLCGGSAMVGAGQTSGMGFEDVYDYPKAIYSYPASIAGRLQQKLQARYPAKKIQVVNTASYMRVFNQSHVLYLETVTHLAPDLVISMDGYNDLGSLTRSQNGYYQSEKSMLPQYLGLYYNTERRGISNFVNLLNYATKKMKEEPTGNKDALMESLAPPGGDRKFDGRFFRKDMVQFCASVRADSADFLFVFQPVLSFTTAKTFSERELALKEICDRDLEKKSVPDAARVNSVFDEMGRELTHRGGYYLNANTAPADPGAEVEMFTDYCHFTVAGNDRVADLIFEKIVAEGLVEKR